MVTKGTDTHFFSKKRWRSWQFRNYANEILRGQESERRFRPWGRGMIIKHVRRLLRHCIECMEEANHPRSRRSRREANGDPQAANVGASAVAAPVLTASPLATARSAHPSNGSTWTGNEQWKRGAVAPHLFLRALGLLRTVTLVSKVTSDSVDE